MEQNRKSALNRLDSISKLMDSQFKIPGTNIRFGLDPILGLFPFLGNLAGYLVSTYLLFEMYRNGASGKLLVKMTGNIILDAIFGTIPYIGIIPDVWYKANNRNMRLLKEHYEEGRHQGTGWGIILIVFAVLFGLIGFLIYLTALLFEWIVELFR
jgi:hypothetical protein